MNTAAKNTEQPLLDAQIKQWQATYEEEPEMFGTDPSYPAKVAFEHFQQNKAHNILELGCGHGRDTMFFLEKGLKVNATDYSENGLRELSQKAKNLGLDKNLQTTCHDIRRDLPFEDNSIDGCFSHMLFCMALGTDELEHLSSEIRRVLKPGGLNIYTVRTTTDPDYKTGTHRGEGMYELDGGFIVHFFDKEKVKLLSKGYHLETVEDFEEGGLPKRLFLITMSKNENE